MSASRTFRYALEPLRKKREWERDARGQELARIDAALSRLRERLARAEEAFAAARAQWQARAGADRALDVDVQRLYASYLAHAGRAIESQREELARALATRTAAADKVTSAQHLLEGVERHKARVAREQRRGELAREYKEIDAAWVERQAITKASP